MVPCRGLHTGELFRIAPETVSVRAGTEDQLGALGLVLNVIVLWMTRCIDAVVAELKAEGHERFRCEDVARLSLLKHHNLTLPGRYSFTASVPAAGVPRPLRDPETLELAAS